jgi:hypothetical protein
MQRYLISSTTSSTSPFLSRTSTRCNPLIRTSPISSAIVCSPSPGINIGVIYEGRLLVSETGTGQGQIVSPLLANVYLHFVLDEWIEREVRPRLRGKVFLVRYADDALMYFQYRIGNVRNRSR